MRYDGKQSGWRHVFLLALFGAAAPMQAQHTNAPYPSMFPIAQYRMDRDAEIALARTAAPASISRDAEILVLAEKNFEVAVKGKNGFVCAVGRAFGGPLSNPEFWNPKNRSPICYNPPAVRSLLPYAMKQTGMALAGASKAQITDAIRTAVAKKELGVPESGSMAYMMSKEAYLTDRGGHNLAHLMFELPRDGLFRDDAAFFVSWDPAPVIEFNVPVGQWSDGTSVAPPSTAAGPTKENALEAAKGLAQAMRTNDPDGFCRLLDPDWAVVTGNGDIGAGDHMGDGKMKEGICGAIRAGTFARESYDMDFANARVRLYGNIAIVTANLSVSGSFQNKWFAVKEVQTDVLKWEDGGWQDVLTHETNVKGSLRTDKDSSKYP